MRRDREGNDNGTVAIVIADRTIVVGRRYAMTVSYTAGPPGVAIGGVLRFRLPGLGVRGDRKAPVSCSRADVELVASNWIPRVDGKDGQEFGIHNYLFVTVAGAPLAEGDTISVDYGRDLLQRHTAAPLCASSWKVEVATDLDGTRGAPGSGFLLVRNPPVLRFVPDRASAMEVTIPSGSVVGKPFDAVVRLRDQYHNVATDYCGRVRLFAGLPGASRVQAEHRFAPDDGGVYSFNCPGFETPGIHRITAIDEASGFFARSNPTRTTLREQPHSVFWGDTHCHSCLSADTAAINDCVRRPAGDYAYARDVADLDFCMVTDHVEDLADEEWRETRSAAAEACEPGRFVTFSGFEATFYPSRSNGDRNVYFAADDEERVSSGTTQDLYDNLRQRRTPTMVIPHMHAGANWDLHDPTLERVVEIYSHWGCGLSPESVPPLVPPRHNRPDASYVHGALERGLRLGFIASADHSYGHPGDDFWWSLSSYNGGLAAVCAPSLTREGIWQGLWDRHCYATTRTRILLEFEIDGHVMGDEFSAREPGRARHVRIGAYGTAPIERLEVVKNGRVWHAAGGSDALDVELELADDKPERETDYYYLHVAQADGEQAWSSPIWVGNT